MQRHVFRWFIVLTIAILAAMFATAPVLAAELRSGDTVTVASGEVIDDDLYVAGNAVIDGTINGDLMAIGGTITVNGTVNGSMIAVGRTIIMNGTINGSLMVAASTISINGDVTRAIRAAGGTFHITSNVGGDLLVAGGEVNIQRSTSVTRDLLFGAGTATIDGLVGGDIKGEGREVLITNGVKGNIICTVDHLTIASTADIGGDLTYVSENEANIQSGVQIGGTITHRSPVTASSADTTSSSGITGKLISFFMTLLVGVAMVLIFPGRAAAVAASIRYKPWLSLGWGAIIFFATPVAVLLTLITVIGALVGIVGLILYGIGIFLSQLAVGLFIGYWIASYFREVSYFRGAETRAILTGALALGFAILTLLKLLVGLVPYAALIIWLATVLFGLGSILVAGRTLHAEVQ